MTISLNSTVDGEHAWANQNVIRINYKRPECDDPSGDFAEDPEICLVSLDEEVAPCSLSQDDIDAAVDGLESKVIVLETNANQDY